MNEGNLNPVRSENEAREKGRKGGIKSGEARRRKRDARQSIELLLNMAAQDNLENTLRKLGFKDADITNMNALTAKVFSMAMKGNLEAYKLLMEYGGYTQAEKRREKKTNAEIALLKAKASEAGIVIGDDDGSEMNNIHIYIPDNGRDGKNEDRDTPTAGTAD